MALDVGFAARTTGRLAQMEAPTGNFPGAEGTVYLPLLVGRSQALEVILGTALFNAEMALALRMAQSRDRRRSAR